MKKSKQLAMLAAAREKFSALSKAERAWKALVVMFDSVPVEHRTAVVERLRNRAASRPELPAVLNAIAKTLVS